MFDAHAHLSDPRLFANAEQIVCELSNLGLTGMLLGGVDQDEWQRQVKLKEKFPNFVFTAFGIHPWTVIQQDDAQLAAMFESLSSIASSATAVGELGVDFSKDNSEQQKSKQRIWFERQLELAEKFSKPVIIHTVKGHDLTLECLRKHSYVRGIIHSFRGHEQVAKQYIKLGYILSVGRRTFQGKTPADFSWLTPDQFVIETDSPDLHQKDFTAQNWISELNQNAEFLSKLFKMPSKDVWHLAESNFQKIFG